MDFFTECGGNSLDYLSVIALLQEEYDIPFPTEEGKTLTTVDQLAGFIVRKAGRDE